MTTILPPAKIARITINGLPVMVNTEFLNSERDGSCENDGHILPNGLHIQTGSISVCKRCQEPFVLKFLPYNTGFQPVKATGNYERWKWHSIRFRNLTTMWQSIKVLREEGWK